VNAVNAVNAVSDVLKLELEPIEIGRIEQLHALRSMFGDGGPSTPALAALVELTVPVRIPAGTCVAREQGPVGVAYLIIEGSLEVRRGGNLLGVFGPRSSVGVLAVLSRDTRGFECVALADTVALMLRAEDFLEILEDQFDLMHSAMRGIAGDAIAARRKLLPHAGFSNELRPPVEYPERELDLVERILHLRQTFGLGHSFIDELAELARAAEEVRYPAGKKLWSSGDSANHMIILVNGVVEGTTPEGARFQCGPGDILGHLDMVSRTPRWFDAFVTEDVVALTLDYEVVIDVWEDQPELGFDFIRMLANVLLSLRERVSLLATSHEPHAPRARAR
jgi:CRP-like cAMP-binding protein